MSSSAIVPMLLQSLTGLENEKKKKYMGDQIRIVEISYSPDSLTYIWLDMTETVITELSQSVHHFTVATRIKVAHLCHDTF